MISAIGSLFGIFASFFVVTIGLFVVVKLFQGFGYILGGLGKGVAYFVRHVARFVKGMVVDTVYFAGSLLTGIVIGLLSILNLAIGRWSSFKHYGRAFQDEIASAFGSLYRVGLGHPLRLAFLGPVIGRFERRVPEVMERAPKGGPQQPGVFEGYEVLGTLPAGGSGAQLFLARPVASHAASLGRRHPNVPDRVVIKSFVLGLGSTLPQMIREGRALEAARRLGLLVEHKLSDTSFYYVMPYVDGEEVGRLTDKLHEKAPGEGLGEASLRLVLGWGADVLRTLERFHTGGLWHKDIKPANVLVADGRAHLVDFGLVTPLASGMTLTTHGTEYYRDPEMVRLAMRGVKVHEVDGVKFDLYSVGALLYSMVEGQFPAHGSLSQISKRCPEALRWIIRRSMADVDSRYATAEDMRADLAVVHAATDPFTVRPADLPSLGGERVPETDEDVRRNLDEPSPFVAAAAMADDSMANAVDEVLGAAAPDPERRRRKARCAARRVVVGGALCAVAVGMVHSIRSAEEEADWRRRVERAQQVAKRTRNALPIVNRNSEPPMIPSALAEVAESGHVQPGFLVLSDAVTWTRRGDLIRRVSERLGEQGFRVVDRDAESPADLDLIAGAYNAVQFADPTDTEALEDLQLYLDDSPLDAILWVDDRGSEGLVSEALFRSSWQLMSGDSKPRELFPTNNSVQIHVGGPGQIFVVPDPGSCDAPCAEVPATADCGEFKYDIF